MRRGLVGVLMMAFLLADSVRAEDVQERLFTIQVDGKAAGEARMTLSRRDDGSQVVTSQANVQVRFLLKYTYNYEGTEIWKDGRLVSLQSHCNDNGRRFVVSAAAEEAGLRVIVNGQEHLGRAEVWTTSYWQLPDARPVSRPVITFDVDRGEEQARHLHYLGAEEIVVAGQKQRCDHVRLAGGSAPVVDLWFDAAHRLVREEFMDLGHRTVVQLAKVRR
jgi:hypothetical protein